MANIYTKQKWAEYMRNWRKNNKEKVQNIQLKYRYGITLEDYENQFEKQNGLCSICNKNHGKKLVVEHDHKTKRVRGLTCQGCNMKLAWFEHYSKKILEHLNRG